MNSVASMRVTFRILLLASWFVAIGSQDQCVKGQDQCTDGAALTEDNLEAFAGDETSQREMKSFAKNATSIDPIVERWLREQQQEKGCECALRVNTTNIEEWIASSEFPKLDRCCRNFGDVFGGWGKLACAGTLAELRKSVAAAPCKALGGGKSGIAPRMCKDHVLKLAKEEEVNPINSLLYTLEGKQLSTYELSTLLIPTCWMIQVAHPNTEKPGEETISHFTVIPKLSISNAKQYSFQHMFDLKGNWGHGERVSPQDSSTWKDYNFKDKFPKGFKITGSQPNGARSIPELVVQDSKILADLYLLDYSILANVVEIDSDKQLKDLQETHQKTPLVWGISLHDDKQYVMAFGLIDLFMRFDLRGAKNEWAARLSQLSIQQCTAYDIDPIQPIAYAIRFMRMVGYNLPGPGTLAEDADDGVDIVQKLFIKNYRCGACYRRGVKFKFKAVFGYKEYTYFESEFQATAYTRQQQRVQQDTEHHLQKSYDCEWESPMS